MGIGKCTDTFRGIVLIGEGGGEGALRGNFPWRNLSWGKSIFMKGVQVVSSMKVRSSNKT